MTTQKKKRCITCFLLLATCHIVDVDYECVRSFGCIISLLVWHMVLFMV